MKRFGLAFMLVKEEIVLFFVCTVILIFITSAEFIILKMKRNQKRLNPFSIVRGGQLLL